MLLAKDFIRNSSVYFFCYLDAFAKDFFIYSKFKEKLFKLINDFSPCANSLVPSSLIEFPLNFVINIIFLAKDFIRNSSVYFFRYLGCIRKGFLFLR